MKFHCLVVVPCQAQIIWYCHGYETASLCRLLFWSDVDGDYVNANSKIERANLDGSERMVIVESESAHITGLALDMELDRLYWCSAAQEISTIEYAALDGR